MNDVVVDAFVTERDGVPIAIVRVAVLLDVLSSFVAPVEPLTVLDPAAIGVPVTVQVMLAAAAIVAGGVGVQDVDRPAGKPATAQVADVALADAPDALVQVKEPL